MTKSIVILLPVYKGDKINYLHESLESIRKQSYENFDVYVLIDGPIDKEKYDLIKNYSLLDKRFQIVKFLINRGLGAVLHDGVILAMDKNYDYIVRMDTDDIMVKNRLEIQLKFMENNPQIDVVGGAIEEIDEFGNKQKVLIYPFSHKECFNFFKKRDPIAHPAAFFRKTFFLKAGNYNPKLRKNQDTYLWYKGFKYGCKFANVSDIVLRFRLTEETLKRRGDIKQVLDYYKLRKEINKDLNYGLLGNIYALSHILFKISPTVLKKAAYKVLR